MKKMFYLFGGLYFAFKVADWTIGIVERFQDRCEFEKSDSKEQKKEKVRQPIGFAVERIES